MPKREFSTVHSISHKSFIIFFTLSIQSLQQTIREYSDSKEISGIIIHHYGLPVVLSHNVGMYQCMWHHILKDHTPNTHWEHMVA
jgi:hypothetical protein